MPCSFESVSSTLLQKIHIVHLEEIMSKDEIKMIEHGINNMNWNRGVPGGFIQNIPQRLVNSFGDGSGYNDNLQCVGDKWKYGYWTPAVHQADSTIVTQTEPLPLWLKLLGVKARHIASEKYGIVLNDHTFNLAVCNKYTKKNDEIAAHTDDNEWYVQDLPEGPMFASLTLYPNKKPTSLHEHARFELYIDDKWCHFTLPHTSLLFMPSCIPHRVRRCIYKSDMCTRINITLRSVPAIQENAFDSIRGISNHARYYRLPEQLIVPEHKKDNEHIIKIKKSFDDCLRNHGKQELQLITKSTNKKYRKHLVNTLKSCGQIKLKSNVVNELLEEVFLRSQKRITSISRM